MTHITYLDEEFPVFPDTSFALNDEPRGLLAAGGNLDTNTLLNAYSKGIFPWFSPGELILWWSPSPRMAFSPAEAHFSRSLKKLARKQPFHITADHAFEEVIQLCSEVDRNGQAGTWIGPRMIDAYTRLHTLGYAHSVETWQNGELVGGLYGISIGKAFFGESMFSLQTGASKIAFASLCTQLQHWNFELIDCQVHTPLLASFGGVEINRVLFESKLQSAVAGSSISNWQTQWSLGKHGFDGISNTP